jgi:hypothetical protein
VRTAIPGNLPHGQEYEAVVGGLPQTATPAARHLALTLVALAAALLTLAWSRLTSARALNATAREPRR